MTRAAGILYTVGSVQRRRLAALRPRAGHIMVARIGCLPYTCAVDNQSSPACASVLANGPKFSAPFLQELPSCADALLNLPPRRIHPYQESVPLDGQAPAIVALDVRKRNVSANYRPHGSIIMVAHNAAFALNVSLALLFRYTASCTELLILLDQCTDNSFATITNSLNLFMESRIQRIRVLLQPTPIWEAASENILMSISDPLTFYVSVQPDNLVFEFGWDLQLARPLEAFDDVFSVSGMLGHALGTRTPSTRFLKDRPLIRDLVAASAPRSSLLPSRDHYYIRDTSSRGPLLFHASRIQHLGFFDHELYYLEDSDHEIHCRAGVLHGWATGVVALLSVTELSAFKTKKNGEAAAVPEAKNASKKVLSRIKHRAEAVRKTGRFGCLHEQEKRLKQTPPRSEVRPLPKPAPRDTCNSNSVLERANNGVQRRDSEVASALGHYRVFVYEGTAFDNMSSALLLPGYNATYVGIPGVGVDGGSYSGIFAEYTAPVWVHRALLQDHVRTRDPDEADIFFVPLYMAISEAQPAHKQRLAAVLEALQRSRHFRRSNGADHIIAPQAVSREMASASGLVHVRKLLELGFTGAFEVNGGWTGGWNHNRTIVMPYVANPFLTPIEEAHVAPHDYAMHNRSSSIFYYASVRDWAVDRAGCQRLKLRPLESYPGANVMVKLRSKHLAPQDQYANAIRKSAFCPLTCGDTPTSRRTFDAFATGCVPIIVGTRLFGNCEPPCRQKAGWFEVVGPTLPHLPYEGVWMNWSVFPTVDEKELYAQKSAAGVHDLFRTAITQVGGEEGAARLRAQMYAQRSSMIYGWGDYRTSTVFGHAARRLVEAVLFRLREVKL